MHISDSLSIEFQRCFMPGMTAQELAETTGRATWKAHLYLALRGRLDHWHALRARGMTYAEIGESTDYSATTVYQGLRLDRLYRLVVEVEC